VRSGEGWGGYAPFQEKFRFFNAKIVHIRAKFWPVLGCIWSISVRRANFTVHWSVHSTFIRRWNERVMFNKTRNSEKIVHAYVQQSLRRIALMHAPWSCKRQLLLVSCERADGRISFTSPLLSPLRRLWVVVAPFAASFFIHRHHQQQQRPLVAGKPASCERWR